ncbi:MAG TPA: alpha/beta fold hydrolase [Bacteriovoracaceae bacterium]|nr:alpha/beta fold hydrolase [Bacteriovoracaceae bacterium]
MASKVICLELSLPWFQVNALAFIPSMEGKIKIKPDWAFFSHGYTSHKGDCLNWATRLVEAGVPCMIFDQPGHYLGSFHELNSLEDFKAHVHELFAEAFLRLQGLMEVTLGLGQFPACTSVILGGHSLGAFTSIKALELPAFKDVKRVAVGVGIGIGQGQGTHIFETAFYERTLAIRRQLVSPVLESKVVFSWLKEEKSSLTISGQRIHLITGEDDVVVGTGGLDAFRAVLEQNGNSVTCDRPNRLAHHEPGAATAHLFSFLKDHFGWV